MRKRPFWTVWCAAVLLELVILIVPLRASASGPVTTTVQDTLYRADGTVSSGTLLLSWPAFSTASGQSVPAGSKTVTIGADGFVSVNLTPNWGAIPAGSYYTAIYHLSDGTTSKEYWLVPATATTTIGAVRAQVVPAAVAVQTVSKQYVDSSVASVTGNFVATAGGTMQGPLLLSSDPNASLQAATKHYVDQQVSGVSTAVANSVQRSGDTMAGPLTLAGDPQGNLDAATKQFVLSNAGTVNALPLAGGTMKGAITLADGSQAASQSYVLAHSGGGSAPTPIANSTVGVSTALSAAQTNGAHAVLIEDGASGGFTNPNLYPVIDLRTDVPASTYSIKAFGAYCDARTTGMLTSISGTTLTVHNTILSSTDTGKTVTIGGTLNGVQAVWTPTIAAVTSGSTATLSSAVPAGFTSYATDIDIGHDDTASIQAALDAVYNSGGKIVITIPAGICMTHRLKYRGESLRGLDKNASILLGFPAEDVLQATDPSQPGYQQPLFNSIVDSFTIYVNARLDATVPWSQIDANGNVSSGTVLNRPAGLNTTWANNPVAPGWFQGTGTNYAGAFASAGSIANGSTTLTVASGGAIPLVGAQVVFPYLTTVFSTTVAAVNGNTVTLAVAYPGPTSSQVEFWAGSNAQHLSGAMGSSDLSLSLANSIAPSPVTESNVAPYGVIQIDAEQIQYGNYNRTTGTFTNLVRGYNGTSAASHNVGAVMVALNPFYPSTPWPVTPTVNSNDTTPVGAAFYPAWNVGNAGVAWPTIGNTAGSSTDSWFQAHVSNISVLQYPFYDPGAHSTAPAGYQNGWNVWNNTAGFFFQQPPYATEFDNLNFNWTTYGVVETPPTTHYHQWLANEPTSNGNSWKFLTIHAWHLQEFMFEAECQFDTANMYSEDTNGTAGTGFLWHATADDQTGGGGDGAFGNVVNQWYAEAEVGSGQRHGPWIELDASASTYTQLFPGGGEAIVGAAHSRYISAHFNSGPAYPLVIYGAHNTIDTVNVSAVGNFGQVNNSFGSAGVLNYGTSNDVSGPINGSNSPIQNLNPSGSRAPFGQQNADFLRDGPTSNPVQDYKQLVIYPDEMTGGNIGHQADGFVQDASAPVTQTAAWCYSLTGQYGCQIQAFNNIFAGMGVGTGQRIPAQKMTAYATFRADSFGTTGASSTTGTWLVELWCPGNNVATLASQTITVTTSWQTYAMPVDFTPYATSGCGLVFHFLSGASVNAKVYSSYLAFQPFASNLAVQSMTAPAGTAITFNSPISVPGMTLGGTVTAVHLYSTGSVSPAAIGAGSCADQSYTVSGVMPADNMGSVRPPAALGNVSVTAFANAANTVTLHFCNPSGASVTPPAGAYAFLAMH